MQPDTNVKKLLHSLYSQEPKYEYATPEQLLLLLVRHEDGRQAILDLAGDPDALIARLDGHIKSLDIQLPSGTDRMPADTPSFERIMQRGMMQVRGSGRNLLTMMDLLVAIAQEDPNATHASAFLHQQGITRSDLVNYVSHGVKKTAEGAVAAGVEQDREDPNAPNPLRAFAVNLNERAAQGKIDPLVGREAVIERTVRTLARRRKNNPLLVGDPGVGKTAIAEGLAQRIVKGEVPDRLKQATVYALDLAALVAGTKYRGEFEQRLKNVLKKVENNPNAVLFIDEIHTLIGAGSASGGAMDAANILKPALANGSIKVIGATTHTEKRTLLDKDHALARRFQVIDVDEPSVEDAIEILKGLKGHYEKHHGVTYDDRAIEHAVHQSVRHITDRRLPDKAIDVIDEAGAAQSVAPEGQKKSVITVAEIDEVIASMAKLPPKRVKGNDKERLRALPEDLRNVVFGQDEAIKALVEAVYKARSGLGRGGKEKPQGSFFFAGPTGVGKTEVARQLALSLDVPLLRFDMSEYQEQHSVARLIGAPPGYVGHEAGGLLTEAVTKAPYSVLLLDEFEKAHPAIFNAFLQVMDHGALTDGQGRKTDFRNVIIIITSNAGDAAAKKASIGFMDPMAESENNRRKEINNILSPEFRNRLDRTVIFGKLTPDIMSRVVDKQLAMLEGDLHAKAVVVEFSQALKDKLAKDGYDPEMGARPLQRLIEDMITVPLSNEVLFGQLEFGGEAHLGLNEQGELTIDVIKSNPDPEAGEPATTVDLSKA